MTLELDPFLLTGIEEIDAQHRELFRCVGRVRDAAFTGDGAELTRAITFLRAYVETHFETEERFMAVRTYPGLARHREEHAHLLEAVLEIESDHRLRGPSADSAHRIERFLSDWLRTHIGVTDLAMARFVRRARRG